MWLIIKVLGVCALIAIFSFLVTFAIILIMAFCDRHKERLLADAMTKKVVDSIDFCAYDSKGRKVHRRELYEDMKGRKGQ